MTSRVFERLEELYAIGGGPGANRPHRSAAEDEAFELAAGWMRAAGLATEVDEDGNLFGHALGSDARTGPLWTGSHLDTVPAGGKFDGAVGVVAGIEAIERTGAGSVAAFRGEEVGCIGSRAFVARGALLPAFFLELHVEQGPVLERAGAPLGVVTSIAGMVRGEQIVEGRAGHAGTVPMQGRDDALVAAAAWVLRIREVAAAIPGAVATVGELEVEPGAGNVIPSRVRMSIDARAPDRERLDELVSAVGFDPGYRTEPVAMGDEPRRALREEIEARALDVVELPSGAGHDAGILAAAGVSAGMLFVRSLNGGISHSPEELSSVEDIELATDVLAEALRRLAGQVRP
jgi:acetylornithine deacetylase/succinyl-diaminopimelate desuccinylase-like protein